MVSGFIASVKGHIITDKFIVLAKVRHSQCMNESLIPIWIIMEREGTVLSAHCLGCKASLAESCSHKAGALFYLEAWTKLNGNLSCMQVKCSWILPTYVGYVDYARVQDINFTLAKKMKVDLDSKIFNLPEFQILIHLQLPLQQRKFQPPQKRKWICLLCRTQQK